VDFQGDADKASAKPGGKTTAKSGNLAGKSQDGFVVAGPVVDGERLYWSNEIGWVGRDGATLFYDENAPDPLEATGREQATQRTEFVAVQGTGRFPANLIHDGSPEVVDVFPQAKGQQCAISGLEPSGKTTNTFGEFAARTPSEPRGDTGSAARFFYCAKASKKDREVGNDHPTVKPTDLMRYLCRLVTPPNGAVLDPFMGSGSTGKAAMLEGFKFIGIERDDKYFEIAQHRINAAVNVKDGSKTSQMSLIAA
jgi:hypothetical protein